MIVKKAALLGIGRPVEFPVEFKGLTEIPGRDGGSLEVLNIRHF
jgi:hypothetical protein